MSQVYNALIDLNVSANKLRESIHKNEIFLKATDKQEESFYNMLNTLIVRTNEYTSINKDLKHVLELPIFFKKAQEFVPNEMTFNLDELAQQLDRLYEEERKNEGNFVASADMIILWPLRMMCERMYRTLTGEKYDERFDSLFQETDRY